MDNMGDLSAFCVYERWRLLLSNRASCSTMRLLSFHFFFRFQFDTTWWKRQRSRSHSAPFLICVYVRICDECRKVREPKRRKKQARRSTHLFTNLEQICLDSCRSSNGSGSLPLAHLLFLCQTLLFLIVYFFDWIRIHIFFSL